jgi:hypothetical protein
VTDSGWTVGMQLRVTTGIFPSNTETIKVLWTPRGLQYRDKETDMLRLLFMAVDRVKNQGKKFNFTYPFSGRMWRRIAR